MNVYVLGSNLPQLPASGLLPANINALVLDLYISLLYTSSHSIMPAQSYYMVHVSAENVNVKHRQVYSLLCTPVEI